MRVVRGLPRSPDRCVAVAIGNFDGVHLGHQALLQRLQAIASADGLVSCALTFEPHPREFFAAESAPGRITRLREKLRLLRNCAVQQVVVCRFDRRLAQLSAEEFVQRVLRDGLNCKALVIGEDFRFGHQRQGDIAWLRSNSTRIGIRVEASPTMLADGARVSSSAVRAALATGDFAAVERLLGRRFVISGRVVRGQQLGRRLGYATANIPLGPRRPALSGIFAVRVHGAGHAERDAVASLGYRPTVNATTRALLEVHLFDFSEDLYGRRLGVEFVAKLRDEEKFDNLTLLQQQIERDAIAARRILTDRSHA